MIVARQMDARDFADMIVDHFDEMLAQAIAAAPRARDGHRAAPVSGRTAVSPAASAPRAAHMGERDRGRMVDHAGRNRAPEGRRRWVTQTPRTTRPRPAPFAAKMKEAANRAQGGWRRADRLSHHCRQRDEPTLSAGNQAARARAVRAFRRWPYPDPKVLQELAHDHIVELRPNSSAVIAAPTPEETRQIFEARRAIEAALLLACHRQRRPTSTDCVRSWRRSTMPCIARSAGVGAIRQHVSSAYRQPGAQHDSAGIFDRAGVALLADRCALRATGQLGVRA